MPVNKSIPKCFLKHARLPIKVLNEKINKCNFPPSTMKFMADIKPNGMDFET